MKKSEARESELLDRKKEKIQQKYKHLREEAKKQNEEEKVKENKEEDESSDKEKGEEEKNDQDKDEISKSKEEKDDEEKKKDSEEKENKEEDESSNKEKGEEKKNDQDKDEINKSKEEKDDEEKKIPKKSTDDPKSPRKTLAEILNSLDTKEKRDLEELAESKEALKQRDDSMGAFEYSEEINRKVSLIRADITCLEIDGVVNAANKSLLGGGGIDGAIHRAAGPDLYKECFTLKGAETGETKVTRGYNLPARYVLHTVGPIGQNEEALTSCYESCLDLLKAHKIRTIAFCGISTGIYGYPLFPASHVALFTIRKWLDNVDNRKSVDRIILCTFLEKELDCYEKLMPLYFPPKGKTTKDIQQLYKESFDSYDPAEDSELEDETDEKKTKKVIHEEKTEEKAIDEEKEEKEEKEDEKEKVIDEEGKEEKTTEEKDDKEPEKDEKDEETEEKEE